jgi:hypothetical protein
VELDQSISLVSLSISHFSYLLHPLKSVADGHSSCGCLPSCPLVYPRHRSPSSGGARPTPARHPQPKSCRHLTSEMAHARDGRSYPQYSPDRRPSTPPPLLFSPCLCPSPSHPSVDLQDGGEKEETEGEGEK